MCTVEAMPLDLRVDFLAVDEVQLSADREHGHVFTDRVLHARGGLETWLTEVRAITLRLWARRCAPRSAWCASP
jgi:ATP-dependent RNA helicase SUPV3L1/SUV3